MKKIAVVGSRRMSDYGGEVIEMLMRELRDKVKVVTIDVMGCNREVMKHEVFKVFSGTNFEKLNEEVADYADVLVIIEGGKNSGTILLAEKFVEKGKLVCCIPGRITDENSYAPNWLVCQGAIPIVDLKELTALVQ